MRPGLLNDLDVGGGQDVLNGRRLRSRQRRKVRRRHELGLLLLLRRVVVQVVELEGGQDLRGLRRALVDRERAAGKVDLLPVCALAGKEVRLNGVLDLPGAALD